MKHKKVISHNNLPTHLPVTSTIAVYLLLDKLRAPGWFWGAVGLFFVALWIGAIVAILHEDDVELDALK